MSGFINSSGGGGGGSPTGAAGGDLGGTYPNPTVKNITGSASIATVTSGTALNFGTNPSTTGIINLPNNISIKARNAANSADVTLIRIDGSNNLSLGDGINDGYVALNAPTGNLVKLQINSVDSVTVSNNTISLAQTGTAYTISQPSSGAAANNITIAPQATTTGTSGSLVVNVSAPGSGTSEAGLIVQRAGTNIIYMSADPGQATSGYVWLGPNAATPTSSNYSLFGLTASNQGVNTGSAWSIQVSATSYFQFTAGTMQFVQAATNYTINQANNTTSSTTGKTITIQAQNSTGTTSTGGDLILSPGTGTSANGNINLNNLTTTTSAPSAGGAGALPATPAGYLTIKVNGTSRQIAFY